MKNPTEKSDSKDPTPLLSGMADGERNDRVCALRSMLAATEARHSQLKRVRHQPLAAGLTVVIRTGNHRGSKGIILDADYIRSRVLVDLLQGGIDTWVDFRDVSPAPDSGE